MTIFNMKATEVADHLAEKFNISYRGAEFKEEYNNGTGYLDPLALVPFDHPVTMKDTRGRNIYVIPLDIIVGEHQEGWDMYENKNLVIFDRYKPEDVLDIVVNNGARPLYRSTVHELIYHPSLDTDDGILLGCISTMTEYRMKAA